MPIKFNKEINISNLAAAAGIIITGVVMITEEQARIDHNVYLIGENIDDISSVETDLDQLENEIRGMVSEIESGREMTEYRLMEQIGRLTNVVHDTREAIARMEGVR